MGYGYKHGTGGGSAGLNFKVVGGLTQPAHPSENTIWINTAINITSWIFSAMEPENMVEGMVWISTGRSSSVAFNALKKNGIEVYPLFAKQWNGGGKTDVQAKIYQRGEWADLLSEIAFYENGEFNTADFGAISGSYTNSNGIKVVNGSNLTHATAYDISLFSAVEIVIDTYNWGNTTSDCGQPANDRCRNAYA